MSRQTMLFLSTVCAGAAIGLVYDGFRIFRKTAPHKNTAVQLEDLLFWLAVTIVFFYFMLNQNYGEIRFYSILGIALGMTVYFATISYYVVKVSVSVVEFFKRVVTAALRILFFPVNLLVKLLTPPAKKLTRVSRKHLHAVHIYGKMKLRKTARHWRIIRKKV
jgi:spore cortex biosynthesis protein YabQ